MKKLILFVALILFSCQNESESDGLNRSAAETNKVIVLKIDYETNSFEGGTELVFPNASDFTISSTYNPPGDFGSLQLHYQEVNQLLFDGTIIWAGKGELSYPQTLSPVSDYML